MTHWPDMDYNLDPPEDTPEDIAYDQACAEWDECWVDTPTLSLRARRMVLLTTFKALLDKADPRALEDHLADFGDRWIVDRKEAILGEWEESRIEAQLAAYESRMDDY